MSKVSKLCAVIKAAGHDTPATGLAVYHAARAVMAACRCKHPQDTLNRARAAMKPYNVRVELSGGLLTVTTFNRSHIWGE